MKLDISISLILNLREDRRASRSTGRGKEAAAETHVDGKTQARRHSNPLCVVRVCAGRAMSNVNSNLHPY